MGKNSMEMMTMSVHKIDVGQSFARLPFGRHPADGPNNGERFRDEFIQPILGDFDKIIVDFDNARGVGPSFLDEAFGVLVERLKLRLEEFHQKFEFISNKDPGLLRIIDRVVKDHIRDGASA